jgi:hypothetical protein
MGVNQNSLRELDLCPKIDTTRISSNSIQDRIAIVKLLVLKTGLDTESQRKHYFVQARVIRYATTTKIGLTDFSHSYGHFIEHHVDMSEKPLQKHNEY